MLHFFMTKLIHNEQIRTIFNFIIPYNAYSGMLSMAFND
jgi:hypothetical protein